MTPVEFASIIDQLRRMASHLELAAREVETLRKDLERAFAVPEHRHDTSGASAWCSQGVAERSYGENGGG